MSLAARLCWLLAIVCGVSMPPPSLSQSPPASNSYRLGLLYFSGTSVPQGCPSQDFHTAGPSNAQINLVVLYQHSKGVGRDKSQAIHRYAARHSSSRVNLGSFYLIGKSSDQHFSLAGWFRLGVHAAENSLAGFQWATRGVAASFS